MKAMSAFHDVADNDCASSDGDDSVGVDLGCPQGVLLARTCVVVGGRLDPLCSYDSVSQAGR